MKRLVIITVGKTHSGKTTFARALEKQLKNTRVAKSCRSTNILRVASNFKQVLVRQQAEARQLEDLGAFTEDEANCFFEIKNGEETQFVIKRIINIAESL